MPAEEKRQTLWRLLLAGFTLLIIHASLYPWDIGSRRRPAAPFSFVPALNRFIIRDCVSNILFYAPFGIAFVLASRRKDLRTVFAATGSAAVLSATLEMIQTTQVTRSSSALDLVSNAAGAAGAAVLTVLYRRRIPHDGEPAHPSAPARRAPAAWVLLVVWLCFKFYPGLPLLSRTRFARRLSEAASTSLSGWDIAIFAGEWIAVAQLLELGIGTRIGCLAVIAAILTIPARLLFDGPVPGFSELAGACVGILLWANLAAGRERGTRIAAGALLASIAISGLAPFDFQGPPNRFSWVPFGATLEAERTGAIGVLLGKLFRYGAAFWLLCRSGMRSRYAAATVCIAAIGIEVLQIWLPGRSPEITDLLITLFAAGGITALEIRGSRETASATGSSSGLRAG